MTSGETTNDAGEARGPAAFFSAAGRLDRARCLGYWLAACLIAAAATVLNALVVPSLGGDTAVIVGLWGVVIVGAALLYVSFVLFIKRLHDINRSGWYSLALLVPLVDLVVLLMLFLARGTKGANDYGPPPPPVGRVAVVAISLLVTIAILGVLGAITMGGLHGGSYSGTEGIVPIAIDDMKLLLKTVAFAAHKHKDQRRKDIDASPYINHPIALVNILCNEVGIDHLNVICAALLHDTVEDTDTTLDELEDEFGKDISGIVAEVTDDKRLRKQERKRLQIEHAAFVSNEAKLVKLADKVANLRDIANSPPAGWDLARQQEYFDWAKAVVDRLRGVHPMLEKIFDEAYARRPG